MPGSGLLQDYLTGLAADGSPDDAADYVFTYDASADALKKVLIEDLPVTGASGIPVDGWVAAGETWTYASADDPTFTFTVAGVDLTTKYQSGMRVKLTQTTAKYFIITKVAFSTDTTITIYGGTDYDLANAAITNPYYSPVKAPFGFPLDPAKWTVEVTDTTQRSQATPVSGNWYNLGTISISIPIGVWDVYYSVGLGAIDSASDTWTVRVALSTANNSVSDIDLLAYLDFTGTRVITTVTRRKAIALTAKTTHYIITGTTVSGLDTIYNNNDFSKLIIRAVCAYL